MARPRKNTVDYFPHQCVSGKTMFVIEQEFGNDGYAFWFKLLELLGQTEGHVFDCRNVSEFRFLLAKTKSSEDMANKILGLLKDLGAIDGPLWEKRVIWCQNFVDGLSSVYHNRKVEMPSKPSFYGQKLTNGVVSTEKSTQSKVE